MKFPSTKSFGRGEKNPGSETTSYRGGWGFIRSFVERSKRSLGPQDLDRRLG